jgi:hypothetical protein
VADDLLSRADPPRSTAALERRGSAASAQLPLAALRAAGRTKVFVLLLEVFPGLTEALERDYEIRRREAEGMALWVAR